MTPFEAEVRALRDRGEMFDRTRRIHLARAPGRLDLMGGNDDYTGGMVFESTIREATWAAAQPSGDRAIVLVNPQMREHGWQQRVEVQLDALSDEAAVRAIVNRDKGVRWTAYVLGLFHWLKRHFPERVDCGMSVLVQSDVPLNKGVSSSAAIEVAVMKATAGAYGIDLAGVELAEACQWAENVIAESACGIMDQIAVVLGDEGCVLPLVCQTCLPQPLVRLPEGLTTWGIDSGVSHQVSGVEYEAARAAAFMGYKLICDREAIPVRLDERAEIPRWTDPRFNGYLANLSPSEFRRNESELPVTLSGAEYLKIAKTHVDPFTAARPKTTYRIRSCTRYAVEENHRVRLFAELARGMSDGYTSAGALLMGELMYQSHEAYTETGLGCEKTDLLVALSRSQGIERGIFGAKITGGGGGGTVAVLGRADAEIAFGEIVKAYRRQTGIDPYLFRGSSVGADRFGIVIVEPMSMDRPTDAPTTAPRGDGMWYLLPLAITNLIWATQGTAVKVLERPSSQGVPTLGPIAITFLPFYVTTLLLIPILLYQRQRNPSAQRPSRRNWWRFAVAGIAGQVLAQLGMTWGTILSLASNQAVLNLLIPVMSAVLASLMLGERLTRLRVLCLVVGLVGVGLMSVRDSEESSLLQQTYLAGNLLIMVGCFGSSFYNVYCKGLLARFGEVEILIFSYITASLATVPLLVWVEPLNVDAFAALNASGWLAFAFLAVFMYGVSMLLFFWVLEHLSVTAASASLYLVPVFGVLIAATVLGEKLSPLAIAGAAIVLASTIVIMRYDTVAT